MMRIQITKVEKDEFQRITSVKNTPKWFDIESAILYEEETYWDGQNRRSVNCDRHCYQSLYKTASNNWVLCNWSNYQGSRTTYEEISIEEANKWLLKNRYHSHVENDELAKHEI